MKKQRKKPSRRRASREASHHAIEENAEFYTASPVEKPLYGGHSTFDTRAPHGTRRHRVAAGRKEQVDRREKLALEAILRLTVMTILLVIGFFVLWKGISLYEESSQRAFELEQKRTAPPTLKEAVVVEDFDITNMDARKQFAGRVDAWREASRLIRSADGMMQRNLNEQSIAYCRDALKLDPTHMGALDRLGTLYFKEKNYTEAVNTYIRLLSIDPAHSDVQKKLIQALDGLGDANAVMYMTEWYLQDHLYDVEIQRYLANAHFTREEYPEAVTAYTRLLRDLPQDVSALEHQADALMIMKEYEKALVPLETLHANYSRRQEYYKKIAICNAQLLKGKEAAQILGRAAQLFQKIVVVGWIQDPMFDPIRTDRIFQAFTDRVAGSETRMRLEALAAGQARKAATGPKLVVPKAKKLDAELLKPGK